MSQQWNIEQKPETFGERFLAAFRGIVNHLRTEQAVGGDTPFGTLVRRSSNRAVGRYLEELLEFADLRNAITHRRRESLLATPTEQATVQLESILRLLTDPPRLDTAVGTRKVDACQPSTRVREAASMMRAGDFSQLPVYKERTFVALLTAEPLDGLPLS